MDKRIKLTKKKVLEICKLRAAGMKYREIAAKYNMSTGHMANIVLDNTCWKDI